MQLSNQRVATSPSPSSSPSSPTLLFQLTKAFKDQIDGVTGRPDIRFRLHGAALGFPRFPYRFSLRHCHYSRGGYSTVDPPPPPTPPTPSFPIPSFYTVHYCNPPVNARFIVTLCYRQRSFQMLWDSIEILEPPALDPPLSTPLPLLPPRSLPSPGKCRVAFHLR